MKLINVIFNGLKPIQSLNILPYWAFFPVFNFIWFIANCYTDTQQIYNRILHKHLVENVSCFLLSPSSRACMLKILLVIVCSNTSSVDRFGWEWHWCCGAVWSWHMGEKNNFLPEFSFLISCIKPLRENPMPRYYGNEMRHTWATSSNSNNNVLPELMRRPFNVNKQQEQPREAVWASLYGF